MSSDESSTPSTFPIFSKLPLELRWQIWHLTLQPRAVEIRYNRNTRYRSLCEIPPALIVCQESRNAIIRDHPLCFSSVFSTAGTRFNFAIDTLLFNKQISWGGIAWFLKGLKEKELSAIKYLAVYYQLTGPSSAYNMYVQNQLLSMAKEAVERLPALTDLFVVFEVVDFMVKPRRCNCKTICGMGVGHYTLVNGERDNLADKLDSWLQFDLWKNHLPAISPISGWRKCMLEAND
jgi:hypothetical protein